MNILFISHAFAPGVGGVETMARLLAAGFARSGHRVTLVTRTPGEPQPDAAFAVVRRPGARELWRLFRESDVVVHNNITLRAVWPLLLLRRPWFVIHHTWIRQPGVPGGLSAALKRAVLRWAQSICVSRALAAALPHRSHVVPNCYDAAVFRSGDGTVRAGDLLFVGRLVPDKGTDLLLSALVRLASEGLRPALTIVGDGPEAAGLKDLAERLGLGARVSFVGSRTPGEVAALMREHRVLVVPSRWREPFGLVALEGIACGCVVVGSAEGGLAEAIGPGGLTFPNGDVAALAVSLRRALAGALTADPAEIAGHLSRHRPEAVIESYLDILTPASFRRPEAVLERQPAAHRP